MLAVDILSVMRVGAHIQLSEAPAMVAGIVSSHLSEKR